MPELAMLLVHSGSQGQVPREGSETLSIQGPHPALVTSSLLAVHTNSYSNYGLEMTIP